MGATRRQFQVSRGPFGAFSLDRTEISPRGESRLQDRSDDDQLNTTAAAVEGVSVLFDEALEHPSTTQHLVNDDRPETTAVAVGEANVVGDGALENSSIDAEERTVDIVPICQTEMDTTFSPLSQAMNFPTFGLTSQFLFSPGLEFLNLPFDSPEKKYSMNSLRYTCRSLV